MSVDCAQRGQAVSEECPPWRRTSSRASPWRKELNATKFVWRAVKYGILDLPTIPFTDERILPNIPQTPRDLQYAEEDLSRGLREKIYEEVTEDYALDRVSEGMMVSSAFTVWRIGSDGEEKPRFVVNFHLQSQHWPRGSVKMETLPAFAIDLLPKDHLMSWDIKGGYRAFYLHPRMRDYFFFHYQGRYFRCIALPFGWGRSAMWFTKLLKPLVRYLCSRLGYRVLPYIDDFLIATSPHGRVSSLRHCRQAQGAIGSLLQKLGIVRHPTKGCWHGYQRLQHLGFGIDTVRMTVSVVPAKVARVSKIAKRLLQCALLQRRLVSIRLLRHFCGVCVSLSLAFPLSRFYTRSLYDDMSHTLRHDSKSSRVRLSRQSMRDLRHWRPFTQGQGSPLHPKDTQLCLHSDAADIGYGGTLGTDHTAGSQGSWEGRGLWRAKDRALSITLRELRAVRLLLSKHFAQYLETDRVTDILVQEDNRAVTLILNAMVSASRPMM